MTISINLTAESQAAFEWRLAKFNDGSGADPLTLTQYIQARTDDSVAKYQAQMADEKKLAIAANPRMMGIASTLWDLSPEELDAKLTAIEALLP